MTSYQVLDIPKALKHFGDEDSALDMINQFAEPRNFKQIIENYHKEVMAMKLSTGWDSILGCFCYITLALKEKADKKEKEKLLHMHLILLRKFSTLHRELEDYLQKPVASPDFKKCVEECMKELKIGNIEVEREGIAKNNASCAGCSIF